MKTTLLLFCLMLCKSHAIISQEIPGLSYCLLFDSELEKRAFQQDKESECDPLLFLLSDDPLIDSTRYASVKGELITYAQNLETKQRKFKSEKKFLRHVFYDVHKRYLRNYTKTETFAGLFNDGSYNCVSGTALYACLLDRLGYSTKIYETRYHIFLLIVLGDSSRVLFETTDPIQGFVDDTVKINERIRNYLADEQRTQKENATLSAPFHGRIVLEEVSLKELAGLHYYNIGVDLINHENYFDAFRALKKAGILYPGSQRIKDFLWFTQESHDVQLTQAFISSTVLK